MSEKIAITKEQKEAYIQHPNRCPKCRSENLQCDGFESDDNDGWREVRCKDCGLTFKEIFKVVDMDVELVVEKPPFKNIFRLYSSVTGCEEATKELKKVADECLKKIRKVQGKYERLGATDTDSREGMAQYLFDNL
jgi:transposase-like protein